MMNFGLMAAKAEARRLDRRNMNIVERSAFWFRYERNSQSPREDYSEKSIEIYKLYEDIEWSPRQWDIVNQLRGEMRFLSSKVNELRAKKKKDVYTIT